MEHLVIDISDILEELGILFANLIEDFPVNEYIHSPNLEVNEQDPIISPTENGLHLSEAVNHAPGNAQPGEHRYTICTQTESPGVWMGFNTDPGPGWRSGAIWQQYIAQEGFQVAGGRSIYGQSGSNLRTGSIPPVQELCRLEPVTRTMFPHKDTDHRPGWMLRSSPVQRPTSIRVERNHVAGRAASNKSPPVWSQT